MKYLISMMSDDKGTISHKRIIASISSICLLVAWLGGLKVSDHLSDLVFYLICGCMGLATADKFVKNENK